MILYLIVNSDFLPVIIFLLIKKNKSTNNISVVTFERSKQKLTYIRFKQKINNGEILNIQLLIIDYSLYFRVYIYIYMYIYIFVLKIFVTIVNIESNLKG